MLKRHLAGFGINGLDLVWDGVCVKVSSTDTGVVFEEHRATTLATATEWMAEIEDDFMNCCGAMA